MNDHESQLLHWIQEAAHLLPAQGPISVFVHHNTLHAFEEEPFEQAVVHAGRLFDCEPYLLENEYRRMVREGQILASDIDGVVRDELGDEYDRELVAHHRVGELADAILEYGIEEPDAEHLDWHLDETSALDRLRGDLPAEARARIREFSRFSEDRQLARALWRASLGLARRELARAADANSSVSAEDVAKLPEEDRRRADDLLIPFTAAYLDQGVARWNLPGRDGGYYRCFLERFSESALAPGGWRSQLKARCRQLRSEGISAFDCIELSLRSRETNPNRWPAHVRGSLLALRGWAGMIHQLESRPDRFAEHTPDGSLVEYLAVRLLVEEVAREDRATVWQGDAAPVDERLKGIQLGYSIYQVAQLLGMSVDDIHGASTEENREFLQYLTRFDGTWRRWILHRAMERRHRNRFLDGLCAASGVAEGDQVAEFQAIFCLDEREESLRRHLEEVAPACETFGTAGYFGVPMYYRGLGMHRGVPLCPISVTPQREVVEVPRSGVDAEFEGRQRRTLPLTLSPLRREHFLQAPITAALASMAMLLLVFKVLFPGLEAALSRWLVRRNSHATRLLVDFQPDLAASLGDAVGFSVQEMAEIVGDGLTEMGMRQLSDLVVVVGHGSASLNNPQESAHDCGACGGGRGGPNARAFAAMANRPDVRRELKRRDVEIPLSTWFVGAFHNTCDDSIDYFDLEDLPRTHQARFDVAKSRLDEARGHDAQERIRRFLDIPAWFPPRLALAHVRDRSLDLAQPRPEYGHASNAACLIGRRERSRGLFLDRRCFLSSYDPTLDDDGGSTLERVLAGVVPVCAGINLEYYFSYCDPVGYGCDTKLPHNITSLLGVMDGYRSDLRTGLPWQMVEIHDPVRLLIVVEAPVERIDAVLGRLPQVARLVQNGWVRLCALSPAEQQVDIRAEGRWQPYQPQSRRLPQVRNSREWYRGRRGHLGVASVGGRP